MRTTRLLSWIGAGALLAAAGAPGQTTTETVSPPESTWAQVTIPYGELKSLWETAWRQSEQAGKDLERKPPVASMLLSAQYDLALDGEKATLTAGYQARSLSDSWQLIPLLGGQARLEEASSGEAGVLWHDGSYCLLTPGRGDFSLTLRFTLSHPADWVGGEGLRLLPGPAALNRFRITGVPEGKTVQVRGLTPTESGPDGATYHLPGMAKELCLALEPYTPPTPPLPSSWQVQSEVFVRHGEGKLVYESRVYAQANEGSGLSMDLLLPHNAQSVVFHGEDLVEGRLGRRQDGLRPLQLQWQTPDILDRRLQVSYEVAQSPLSAEWVLLAPHLADASRTLFVLVTAGGLEMAGENLKDAVQSRRLPEWLRERVGPGDFRTVEAGARCVLQVNWLPRLETAQAMVSSASYETRLVADGALLVQARYTVQHQSPLNWRLVLPAVDEILTCEINAKPAQPVKRGANEIEFNLSAPAANLTQIAFSYAARVDPLDPVSGRLSLELPRTDLFIHRLEWQLTLPDIYETTAIEGNVAVRAAPEDSARVEASLENVIRLKKELVRAEHPAAEIYYQRRGLNAE